MTSKKRLAMFVAMLALFATSAFGRDLPNIDLYLNAKVPSNSNAALEQRVGDLRRDGSSLQGEGRFGVPTVLWLDPSQLVGTGPIGQGAERTEIAAARGVLSGVSEAYGLVDNDVTGAVAAGVINTGKGAIVVKFSQQVGGIPVFREELNVVMNQKLEAIAVTGYISSQHTAFAGSSTGSFSRSETMAAADALKDVTANAGLNASQLIPAFSRDGYDFFTVASTSGVSLADPVRMQKVYYHMPEGLIPAYYIETSVMVRDGVTSEGMFIGNINTDTYSYVISAVDGSILFRKNLTEDLSGSQSSLGPGGDTYRVWADPVTGVPYDTPAGNGVHPKLNPIPDGAQYPFQPQVDVTLPNYPFSQNDPWIAPGSVETVGNNADAYLDLFGLTDAQGNPTTDDGLSPVAPPADPPTGDFRAQATGADQFLHSNVPDTVSASAEARQGAIQQLFYNVNFLHDWYYDSGFTELMRNAQTNNFGRGGLGSDNIRAEVQDYSGFNNANMSTPSDGLRPRMQMYNFTTRANTNEIVSPANIAGKRAMGVAMSGTQSFDVNAEALMATFDGSLNVTNAAALAGKIAMFNFQDTGSFSTKITRLHQQTSCVGVLMVYTSASPNNVANIVGFNTVWSRPVATISFNSAAPIKTELLVPNVVTLRLHRFADRDGALDNQVVFHEWGHYLSNRLISNAAGLSNNQGRSMGEGWGDFNAMMLTVREDDTSVPSNATWGGVYALATYATSSQPTFDNSLNHGYYLGIRRTPYSTDMVNYNAFTFKHIMNGQPLPSGPPVANNGSVNAEVHNSGEVWAEMLWECYASLLRDTQGGTPRMTFQQAQDRMKQYLVASLALTPSAPTFVEARDAVLAAAYATDYTDYLEFWAAFAKRGIGVGAVAPDRASTTHSGVVESFVVAPDAIVVSASTTLDDSVANCDNDGVLDSGEFGKLTVALENVGSVALTGTTATLASTTPGVTFPNGNSVNFPAADPLSIVSTSITVGLAPGIAGAQQLDFQITISDPAITGTRSGAASFRGNTDIIPASSATDTVETYANVASSPWTTDFDVTLGDVAPFSVQTVDPMSHRWFGPNGGAPSDNRLVSPVFTVDGAGSPTIQWDHTWSFETNFDGGVIEMSVNGGAWSDVGVTGGGTTNGYNGTLIAGGTNPLNGRQAWTNTQNVSQHVTVTRAVAPGSTVRYRFRTGADDNTAGSGWKIDNISFSGVVETPFGTLVADTGCTISTSTALTASPNPSAFGSPVTLTATVTAAAGTPIGNVTFYDGATALSNVALSSGSAQLITSSLSPGLHSLTASYAGAAGYLPSGSPSVAQTVSKIATTTVIGSNNNPSTLGSSVTFTATVTGTSGTPLGSVTFLDGATPLAAVSLSGGVATYTTSALTGGNHTINASYGGNGTYFGSNGSVAQVVTTGSTIQFNPTAYSKFENGTMVTLTVTRTGGNTSGGASVQYATVDGTAVSGVRYTGSTGTVNFGNGETSKTFDVLLVNTTAIQGKQTFTVVLSNPNAATLGAATVATVDVMDDDTRPSDFSSPADGKSDLFWRNETTGDSKVWQMNGTSFVSSTDLVQFGGNWRLQGIADFNADGHADVLFRNMADFSMLIVYMNGTNIIGTASTLAITDANWKIVSIGDLTGDGYPDIMWRHSTTFGMVVWQMKDNVRQSLFSIPAITDANWQVRGMGDFNRDGQLDVVWRNLSTSTTIVWMMNAGGQTRASISAITPTLGAPWDIVGVGDMNGDGDADLIWQASTTRTVAIWLMDQTNRNSIVGTSTINDPNWTIVAPR